MKVDELEKTRFKWSRLFWPSLRRLLLIYELARKTTSQLKSHVIYPTGWTYLFGQNGQELNEDIGVSFLREFGESLNDVGQRVLPRVHEHDEVGESHADLQNQTNDMR